MIVIGCLSLIILLYTYIGYPLALYGLGVLNPFKKSTDKNSIPKRIAIIIAARNEEQIIQKKIEDTLALGFEEHTVLQELTQEDPKIELLIASDASEDGTHAIVNSFSSQGVKLVVLPDRGGKERAQLAAIKRVSGDVILFTDAKIGLNKNILQVVREEFSDSSVGAVSSRDVVIDGEGRSGEGAYVGYEMFLRKLESRVYSLIGLSGSCFAVRRSITAKFPEDMSSDFAMSLETRLQGFRSVHSDDMIGTYQSVISPQAEFSRKVRTVLRGIKVLMSYKELLDFGRYGIFAFQLISHKLLRWLAPVFLILLAISLAALRTESFFFFSLFGGMIAFLGAALSGYLQPSLQKHALIKFPLFFCISNLAIMLAWLSYFRGEQTAIWDPSEKG